jgi:hypothetical protein
LFVALPRVATNGYENQSSTGEVTENGNVAGEQLQ